MDITPIILEGQRVRLEPLTLDHIPALSKIAFDPALWHLALTPIATEANLRAYVEAALALQRTGTAMPWVTRERQSGRVIGSTRFMDIQQTHHTLELGSTWLIRECQGTGLNAEAKYLQLQHAFEKMGAGRVALKTHHQNLRSQAAMRAIGARQEGIFRNHYIMPDGSLRHSVWFSVIREDWPQVKTHLEQRMARFFV